MGVHAIIFGIIPLLRVSSLDDISVRLLAAHCPLDGKWACLVKCVTGVFIVVFPRLASGRRR